jgi:rubrerythrin
MAHWSLDDIAWSDFDRGKITLELVSLIKAASMVEYNGYDYARYLCEVFSGDEDFQQVAKNWAEEEVQHGRALRQWAELADPDFDFDKCFKVFTTGYQLPLSVKTSVRGSRPGELIARCIVEIGTSVYYTAIKDYTDEPVLQEICSKIAADEFRHYKMFYTHLQRYLKKENIGSLERFKVAIGRVTESEDDELAYAFYAAHEHDGSNVYNRKQYANRNWACVGKLYRKQHVDRMVTMAFKTIGLKPQTLLNKIISQLAWGIMGLRIARAKTLQGQAI